MAADEEEKVVPEKKGGSNNLIMIIGVALIVISLALSAVSLLTIMNINNKLEAPEETVAEGEAAVVPLNEITTFGFTDDFIFIFEDVENDVTNNVVVGISVGLHNTAEDFADVQTTISGSESILRSGIGAIMARKSYDDFKSSEGMDGLTSEIKGYLQEILVTETVVDVYFHDMLTSTK